ncbi:MAG: type I 3-dehydroquinate dehydratase [Promethearchaeota archaeon]
MPVFSILKARWNAKFAAKRNAQLIEFRLDYFEKITDIKVSKLSKLVHSVPIPVILTLKNNFQDTHLNLTEEKIIELISKCIQARPSFIDIETDFEEEILKKFYADALKNGVGVIYSYHDFKYTPDGQEILKITSELIRKCPGLEKGALNRFQPRTILKLVFYAKYFQDNITVLDVCQKLQEKKINYICFNMGKKGLFSRVFSIKKGALFTYAKLDENLETAPGQISIDRFYYLYEKGEESATEEIAGL